MFVNKSECYISHDSEEEVELLMGLLYLPSHGLYDHCLYSLSFALQLWLETEGSSHSTRASVPLLPQLADWKQ